MLPLEWAPNIGDQPQYGYMNRASGDLQPKWLVPAETAAPAGTQDESISLALDKLDALMRELQSEVQGAFQDAHNTGFYINEYTTKVHSLGDKLFEGMQRIVRKITAQESA